jgi:hypothetical protein
MGLRDKDRFVQTAHNEWQSFYEEFKSTNQRMLISLTQLQPINIHRYFFYPKLGCDSQLACSKSNNLSVITLFVYQQLADLHGSLNAPVDQMQHG